MTDTSIWKIQLPVAAPRTAQSSASDPSETATAERIEAENDLSKWLSGASIAAMKDRDVSILSAETASLMSSSSRDRNLWKAFPHVDSGSVAQDVAERFRTALTRDKANADAARGICEELGLNWDTPALANVETAEKSALRLRNAADEMLRMEESVRNWLGITPSLKDASFLMSVAASLRAADTASMGTYQGDRFEIENAVKMLEEIDRLAAELTAEFGFDPSQHSENAFGGVVRAFSSGKGSDFITAARKLGIAIKGADQAQRAAALLKQYIASIGNVAVLPPETDPFQGNAIVAKARLSQSIRRRMDVMSIDRGSLSPALADIELQDFSKYPGDDGFALNQDTRKLVEDNVPFAPEGAKLSDLADELKRRSAQIGEWTERQRRGLLFAEPGSSHAEVEAILAKNPVPMEIDGGLVLKGAADLDALERHIQWLAEATMLPLSDDQLRSFVSHVAGLKS